MSLIHPILKKKAQKLKKLLYSLWILLEKMNSDDSYSSKKNNTKKRKIDSIEEGVETESTSLASWGKDIMNNFIRPIDEIFEAMSDVSDVSDRSISPILSNQLKCIYCTCGQDDATCACMKCRKMKSSVAPDEATIIDSEASTCIDSERKRLDVDFTYEATNYAMYKAIKQQEKRGTNFIFDVDAMFAKWDIENVKIGVVKSKNISNRRVQIFDKNIFKLTNRRVYQKYTSCLTHVVIDKGHNYREVDELIFKWSGLTEPYPFKVVNEDWLIDFSTNKVIPDESLYTHLRPVNEVVEKYSDSESEYEENIDDEEDEDNNHNIIEIFSELAEIYEQSLINELSDVFKSRAYKTACDRLLKLPQIDCQEKIPTHIWPKESNMWQHIKEIVETGTCEKLTYFRNHPDIITNRAFTKIHGIGPRRARDLMNAGYRSISDLRTEKGLNALRPLERTCLSCYEDLQERIPRDEVKEYVDIVEKIVKNKVPNSEVVAAGSFRRGLATCGDIDILIMVPDNYDGVNLISFLHERLGAKGANLFTYDLTKVSEKSNNYMCIGKLSKSGSLFRRIDVKVYSASHYPFALSAFTGSDHWNRSLRCFARKKGFSLSDKGLYVKSQNAIDYLFSIGEIEKGMASNVDNYVPFINNERDIFLTLGIGDYFKEPFERIGSIFR